jgi:ribonuclease Z
MAKLIFLGTASAVAYQGHENSFLVLQGEDSSILVDCSTRPVMRLKEAGIDHNDLSDLIITHFHPDHVSGLATLIMDMWILGREKDFHIHGCEHAISRAIKLMDLFGWQEWSDLYPVHFHTLPLDELAPVLENQEFKILSSPVKHMIPTLGIRVEYRGGEFVIAYSSDTSPVPETVKLAADADVLIHEAAGTTFHHSTASQAGEIASQAGVKDLYLIHYPSAEMISPDFTFSEAKKTFPGNVYLAEDLMEIEFKGE